MRYLKYIFGIQLFLGSIWSFYYSIYWIGFVLLTLSSFILIPLLYRLLKKKMSGFKSACFILAVFFIGLSWFGISYLGSIFAPVDTNIETVNNDDGIVYSFEQSMINATQPCFSAYDKAFSKSLKYQDEQCRLIYDAQKTCNSAQQDVDNVNIQKISNIEITNLLNGAKLDAQNSLKAWENFFGMYNNQCVSKGSSLNAVDVKLQLISAVKNMYLMNMKIKKAKSIS